MKRFKSLMLVALAIVAGFSFMLQPDAASAQSSASLSIAPKKNYTIEAGKSVSDKLVIRNIDAQSSLELRLRVVDFTFTDDTGTPKLILDENAEQTTWSLKPYITLPESVVIPAGGSKTVDLGVSIPKGVGAGSYYSAIIYSSGASTGGNVGLSASGATLVFTNVPGQVKEDLKLEKFGAYNSTTKKYMFITGDEPQNMAYTLKNSGNVAEAPVGSIVLKDMFGREYTIDKVNPNGSLALRGQTRTYTTCVKLASEKIEVGGQESTANKCTSAGLWPGYYSAKLDLFYGQNGNLTQEVNGTASFWYLPLWFVILVVILLLILAFVVWRIVRWFREKFGAGGSSRNKKLSSRKRRF